LISAQFALEMCLAARNRQKINKNPYCGIPSHLVLWFGVTPYEFMEKLNGS